MTKEIGTLIWDLDGTLAFRAGGWTGALLQVLQLEGIKVRREQLRPHLAQGFPWQQAHIPHPDIRSADQWWKQINAVVAEALRSGAGLEPQAAKSLAQAVQRIYLEPNAWQRFPDALSSLQELARRGWRHVLLSNHVPELRQLLAGLDLTPHFACILNSAETGYEKPHPQAFRLALDACVADRPVWMIGDNFHADIIGAEWIGIPGILVHSSHPLAERQASNLAELASLL
jgi:putative hydrolase of the HAD superfamily